MKKFPFVPTLGAAAALLAFSPAARADNDPYCAEGVQIEFSRCLSDGATLQDPEYTTHNAECEVNRDRNMEGCWRDPPEPELHCGWSWSGPTCWYC